MSRHFEGDYDLNSRDLHESLDQLRDWARSVSGETATKHELAARAFSGGFLRELGRTLPLDEISTILAAERVRERGLAGAREREDGLGESQIAEARSIVENANLTMQSQLAADSFQCAAESYIYYVRGELGEAYRLMIQAIDDCNALSQQYSQKMEFRTVHLARNALRIDAIASNRPSECFSQHIDLLEYLDGHDALWPLADCKPLAHLDELTPEQLTCAVDEILTNIAVITRDAERVRGSYTSFERGMSRIGKLDLYGHSTRAEAFLRAMVAHAADDKKTFVTAANAFRYTNDDALPMAQYCLVKALRR
jgi:hypothetical protein